MTILHADTSAVSVSIDQSAHEQRAKLLAGARTITSVTNAAEQEVAVALGRDIASLLSSVEASRKAVKAPVLALGKKIDETAENFTTGLLGAAQAIGIEVVKFQTEEKRRVSLELKARADAIAIAEAERMAKLDEARAAGAQMQTEADLAKAIAAEAEARAADEASRAAMVAPMPAVAREVGQRMRRVPVITVVDIHATYKARPELVKLELIKSVFNSLVVEGITVPGLKIEWHDEVSFVRTAQ